MKRRATIVFAVLFFLAVGFLLFRLFDLDKSLMLSKNQAITSLLSPSDKPSKPPLDHIVIITMENKTYADIVGNKKAPYINSLINSYSLADNYSAITHPSLPNYLALIGGSTFNIKSDCTDCFIDAPNLVDQLETKHLSWKAYMESVPNRCFIGSRTPYAQKHNPFIYFDDIRENIPRCTQIVPLSRLSLDLQTEKNTANFIWISPNLCHDMHDCSVAAGDEWLKQTIPQILQSPAFTKQNSLVVLTWDEAQGKGPNHIPTIFIGNNVKKNFVTHQAYSHYSLLKTIESNWEIPPLTKNVANAPAIKDILQTTP